MANQKPAIVDLQPRGQTVIEWPKPAAPALLAYAMYDFVVSDGEPLTDMSAVMIAKDDSSGSAVVLFTNELPTAHGGFDYTTVDQFTGERMFLHFDGFPFTLPIAKMALQSYDRVLIAGKDFTTGQLNTEDHLIDIHIWHRKSEVLRQVAASAGP